MVLVLAEGQLFLGAPSPILSDERYGSGIVVNSSAVKIEKLDGSKSQVKEHGLMPGAIEPGKSPTDPVVLNPLFFFGFESHLFRVLQVKFQSHDHGAAYYNVHCCSSSADPDFDAVFGTVWRLVFTPTPALAAQITDTLDRTGLVPGHYSAAHLRALYGVPTREPQLVTAWTQNAVHCAVMAQYDNNNHDTAAAVYFASDSESAVQTAVSYGALHGVRVMSRSSVDVVVTNNNENPLHLDKTKDWRRRPPSDFYSVFVDLFVMSLGRCVAYSMGGYGRMAALMSTIAAGCSMMHMNATALAECPVLPAAPNPNNQNEPQLYENKQQQPIFLPPMPPLQSNAVTDG